MKFGKKIKAFICPFRKPMTYYALVDKDGKIIKTKFKEEKTVDVNIIDDESIKNQIVDFTQELNVAKEENESIVNEVTELKGMIITYEETIKAQEEKVAELESEISKTMQHLLLKK